MQNESERHPSKTTLFQKEHHFMTLHVSIRTESSSGVRTKPLKYAFFFLSEISLIIFLKILKI